MRPSERPTPRRTVQPEGALLAVVEEGRVDWQGQAAPQLPGAAVGEAGSVGRAATQKRERFSTKQYNTLALNNCLYLVHGISIPNPNS